MEGAGKRALITGSAGFTGRYVAQELRAAGYQVHGLVAPGSAAGMDEFSVDLNDRAGLAAVVQQVQPDVVVHLAAIAFVGHGDAEQIYRVNVAGTRNLLEALAGLAQRPAAVLLASSANIYGNTDVGVIGEDVPAAPANDYAVSKLAMEYMARLWSDRLPLIIARPFNYTGVGQDENFLLPKIVSHFRRREARIELGNLHVWRDFSDVRMVANSYRRLLAAPAAATAGRAFNICSGNAHSLGEVLDLMADIAGYRIDVHVNPAFVRANEVVRLVGDNRRLASVIGAAGVVDPVPLADTLRWMYQA
ncbi:GDP-mannose 4,6 dehydratase [Duganella sp. Leaf61]|nr:GDP-mannose 4,6 dehydratase [Duganella sp. Leaf61]